MQDGRYTTYGTRPGRDPRRRRRQRARRRLLLVAVVLTVAAVAAAVLLLRGGDADEAAAEKSGGGGGATTAASPSPTPTQPPPEVWVASKSHPVRVWVGGDSMGGELGWALDPLLRGAKVFKPITFYKESSGICRYDFYDWGKQAESVVRSAKPDAAVIMMGTNDTQSVWQDGEWIAYGKVAWKTAYERRVGEIMDIMLEGGARRVYWVGMPIMGEGWRNSRMRFINRVFENQAEERPGVTYVDAWDLYADESGDFDASLRLGDGVHFTVQGQEMLGAYVYRLIKRDWLPAGAGAPDASPSPTSSPTASSI